jgi:hypothetical protein
LYSRIRYGLEDGQGKSDELDVLDVDVDVDLDVDVDVDLALPIFIT